MDDWWKKFQEAEKSPAPNPDDPEHPLHYMFLSYRAEGFTEDQALKLLAMIIVYSPTPEDS
jgi:hypothetical protein